MCMALTRHNPSCTPLLRTSASTVAVMLTKPRRPGTSNQSCSVSDFMRLICHQCPAYCNLSKWRMPASTTGERAEQCLHLLVGLCGVRQGPGNFLAQQLAIAPPQTVDGHAHRAFAHLQTGGG